MIRMASVYDIIGINTAQRTITIQGGISTIPHIYIGWESIGISTFEYTETTGISTVVTVQPHGFEANDNITLIDLPFSCASEHIGVTTTLFPDGSGDLKFTFKVSEVINDTTFVRISTIAHIYEGFGRKSELVHSFIQTLQEFQQQPQIQHTVLRLETR
jgi:hypothetical protein